MWVASVIVRRVCDEMYEVDVQSKYLTQHANYICDKRLKSFKELISSDLPPDYLFIQLVWSGKISAEEVMARPQEVHHEGNVPLNTLS